MYCEELTCKVSPQNGGVLSIIYRTQLWTNTTANFSNWILKTSMIEFTSTEGEN
jgi:hypothetical protein